MQKINSVIITSPEERNSRIGTQVGALGSETQSSLEIAAWLSKKRPTDMDRAAVSRALSHGVKLNVVYEGRYPQGPNGEKLPSYQVAVSCQISGNDEQRKAALVDLVKFNTPAPSGQIEKWIAELSVITAGRNREGFDAELMIGAYTARLGQFPADVVKYALLDHSWKWFPTWAELEAVCRAKSSPRQHMIAALMRPDQSPEPSKKWPTTEEKERMRALIAEKFPTVAPELQDRALSKLSGDGS